jgi:hypothetical protein
LGDDVNYRECIVNLKESLDEYKRIYKLRLWKKYWIIFEVH